MTAKQIMDFSQRAIASVLIASSAALLVLNIAAAWDFLGWAKV
jgi:hypothetical protein